MILGSRSVPIEVIGIVFPAGYLPGLKGLWHTQPGSTIHNEGCKP